MTYPIEQIETQIQALPQAFKIMPPGELKPYPNNSRTHPNKQKRQLIKSIKKSGFVGAIIIDENNVVLAGHLRLDVALELGLRIVPVIQISHLTKRQKRAYVIADNKLGDNAGWDIDILHAEVTAILSEEPDFDFDGIGFETSELDVLLDTDLDGGDPADQLPNIPADTPVISRAGDLFILGHNRLLCGNARKPDHFKMLMKGKGAQAVFADVPYNVKVTGNVSGLGKVRHDEFAMASGEMSEEEYRDFLKCTLGNAAEVSADGSVHFVCIDWRHLNDLIAAGLFVFSRLLNICVWVKTNGGMGSLYRSQHEFVVVFKNGKASHINNVQLGKHGRNRTNVWQYAGVNTFREGREEDLAAHPTVKPVALVEDAIKDVTDRGDIVLDPFVGSGTTILAAERCGRDAYAMEIDPKYVDVAIRRWQTLSGKDAIHEETGLTFSEIAQLRDPDVVTPHSQKEAKDV